MISADNYSRRRAKFFLRQDNNSCKLGFKKYKSETLININNCIIIDPEIMISGSIIIQLLMLIKVSDLYFLKPNLQLLLSCLKKNFALLRE